METYTVVLPSGLKVKNIPVGTSKEEIKDKLISSGKATLEDFKLKEVETQTTTDIAPDVTQEFPTNPRVRGSTVGSTGNGGISTEDISQLAKENLGLIGGVGGAIVGAPFGPAASIALSSLGTGAGELFSADLKGEERDYAEAMKQAAISLGFDVATLGTFKFFKPSYIALKKRLGFTPEEAAEQMIKELEPSVGTVPSLRASQQILEEGGATLTPFQVGATGTNLFKEKLARAGIISSGMFEKNIEKVNEVAQESISEVVNRLSVQTSGTPADIAEQLMNVIEEGNKALIANYGKGLDELSSLVPSGSQVGLGKHIAALNRFVATRTEGTQVKFTDLDPAALDFIESRLKGNMLGNNLNAKTNLKGLLILDKQLTAEIRTKFGTPGTDSYNKDAARQLSELADEMREATYNALAKVNPDLAEKFKILKQEYASGIQGLLPKINKNFVSKAGVQNYAALGQVLTKAGNTSQILQFKRSLKEAFNQIEKTGQKTTGQFIAYEEAEALLKKGFLQNVFPDLNTGSFDISSYANLAKKLSNKAEEAKFKTVLGADFPKVKQIINLMSEASVSPVGNLGELMLRNKEYSAIGQFATGQAIGGFAGSAAVLLTPVFLAKAALNPKNVNKLIAFDKTKFKTTGAMEAAAVSIIGSVLDDMTEEEQAEFRNAIREFTGAQQ